MEKHLLSKSTFIRSLQCQKSLYLYKNRYFLRDKQDPVQLAKFKRGTKIGIIAQQLFPGGIDAGPKSPSQYRKALGNTQELISNGEKHLYEAVFQHDQVLVISDVVEKTDAGWNIYEVKSSAKVSETYINDAAVQYYVIKGMGHNINKFSLVHINTDYIKDGEIDLKELFTELDVTDEVISRQENIKRSIEDAKASLQLKSSPKIDIGLHCHTPYPCNFWGHCHKHLPKDNIFKLVDITEEEQLKLYKQGKRDFDSLSDETLSIKQTIQIEAHHLDKAHKDLNRLKEWTHLKNQPFQIIHLIRTWPAFPVFEKTHAYQSIYFGSSLCTSNPEEPKVFIADSSDPISDTFEFLEKNLNAKQTIICFDKDQTIFALKSIEQHLQRNFTFSVDDLIIYGLNSPIHDMSYYHPAIEGDFSLKSVLSALTIEGKSAFKLFHEEVLVGVKYEEQLQAFPSSDHTAIEGYLLSISKALKELFNLYQ